MVRLGELVRELGGVCAALEGAGPEVVDAHLDSRRVGPGSLFAALSGHASPSGRELRHGGQYAGAACQRGAVALLSDVPLSEAQLADSAGRRVPNWVHGSARQTFGQAAAIVHGRPSRKLFVIAVTGTNGKTSTAHLCGELLAAAGREPAVLGTVGYRLAGGVTHPATHTTPDAGELQRLCAEHLRLGGDCVVLEASSHALEQDRLAGLEVDVAIFTNLTPEHLDYHGDMRAYARAKARLFEALQPGSWAVVRADDPAASQMADAARARGAQVVEYRVCADAQDPSNESNEPHTAGARRASAVEISAGSRVDLTASALRNDSGSTCFFLSGMGVSTRKVQLPLLGRFNVENAIAATAAALLSGASPARVLAGLAAVSSAPGRLEPVPTGAREFTLLVDFAHTEHALERVLETARELCAPQAAQSSPAPAARLICVFGCGGDRDRSKRAPMGRVVGRLADLAILTNDNPRGEQPAAIAEEVLRGLEGGRAEVRVELDRALAIQLAIDSASAGDVILIAGKGHEPVQVIGDQTIDFDDRRVAREALDR